MFFKKNGIQKQATNKKSTYIIDDKTPFVITEAYHSLRTNLSFLSFGGEVKTILITSALPGEGKSTVAINIARALTLSGSKVLLVDADLRAPSLHRYLRIKTAVSNGLSSVLSNQCEASDAIYSVPSFNFDVMLSGPKPPNAPELFSRSHLKDMLTQLRERYDYIILDTAPVGIVSDTALLSEHVDGSLFVIRQQYADRSVIAKAIKNLEASQTKILGSILNDYQHSNVIGSSESSEYYQYYGSTESDA